MKRGWWLTLDDRKFHFVDDESRMVALCGRCVPPSSVDAPDDMDDDEDNCQICRQKKLAGRRAS